MGRCAAATRGTPPRPHPTDATAAAPPQGPVRHRDKGLEVRVYKEPVWPPHTHKGG